MFKRLLPGLAAWPLVAVAAFAWTQTPGRAFEPDAPRAVPAVVVPHQIPFDAAVAEQMFALDRHVRMDMVLSASPAAGSGWAASTAAAPVLALSVGAGK